MRVALSILLFLTSCVEAKKRLKVLVYSTTVSYSHIAYNGRLAEILKDAGHEVHLLLPITDPNVPYDGSGKANRVFRVPLPHGHDILAEMSQLSAISEPFSGTVNMILDGFLNTFRKIDNIVCRDILENEELMRTLKAGEYDIGIAESLSFWPFGLFHAIGIRTTFGSTPVPLPFITVSNFGIPSPASFTPSATTTISANGDRMNLWERAQNMFFNWCQDVYYTLLYWNQQAIFNGLYGSGFPDLRELMRNMSFIFVNSNPLLEVAKAASPKVVYIGGVVESSGKGLSQELRSVFERSNKGVVFFSLGTLANTQHMSVAMRKAFLAAFAKFPEYEFVWKSTDAENKSVVARLPSNVHLFNWVDQVAILEHPKIAAFVTHCGLNSLNEAALNGVPLVTVPLFADQLYNAGVAKSRGINAHLDIRLITESGVVNALKEVLDNPRYRENAQLLKRKMRNYPLKPADLFLRHVEYAAEFPPLSELTLAGADMSAFHYHNLDVWLIFSLLVGLKHFAGSELVPGPMLPLYIAISIPVELIFLAFHLSVWYFVGYQIAKKNPAFSSAFFVVYVLQSFADVGNYFTMTYKERLCKYGLIPPELRPTPFICSIVYFCYGYFSSFQFVAHCIIAINRYTVILHPTIHTKIWSGMWLNLVAATVVVLPGACSAVRWFMECTVVDIDGGYVLVSTPKLANKISGVIHVTLSLLTCSLSCVLEYQTFFAFRKMSSASKKEHGEDYRLLLYAMMGFFAHVVMATVYVFVYIVGGLPSVLNLGYPYFIDILCLGGPVCLFYTRQGDLAVIQKLSISCSKHLRQKYLAFYGFAKNRRTDITTSAVDTTKVFHK